MAMSEGKLIHRPVTHAVVWMLLCATGCGQGGQPAAPGGGGSSSPGSGAALVKVTPIRPVRKVLIRRSEQPGQVEAFEETPLFAKVAGHVEKIHVDIGDAVQGPRFDDKGNVAQPGQVLAELSVPELGDELRQKQALVGQAQALVQQQAAAIRVAEAAQLSAQARVEEVQAAVEGAQADYDRYKSEFERIRALADKGAVTRQIVDEKENLFRGADAARHEISAKVASAKAAVAESYARLDKSRADFEAAQANVRVAQAEEGRVAALLSYTTIRAPFDGVVAVRNVHTGHLVQPGTGSGGKPLLVVIRIDKVRIFIDVPEGDAVLIGNGIEAKIRIPSLSSESFAGKVTRSSWMLNAGTRTLKTEIDVENPAGRLRPGMYAYADLKVAERSDALALPHTALFTADGATFCYSIDESGHLVRRPLVVGIRAGDEVEIVSGLSGEDHVIGVNPAAFREGQQVEVVVPPPKS